MENLILGFQRIQERFSVLDWKENKLFSKTNKHCFVLCSNKETILYKETIHEKLSGRWRLLFPFLPSCPLMRIERCGLTCKQLPKTGCWMYYRIFKDSVRALPATLHVTRPSRSRSGLDGLSKEYSISWVIHMAGCPSTCKSLIRSNLAGDRTAHGCRCEGERGTAGRTSDQD